MRRHVFLLMIVVALLASCQQKEEPKPQYDFPSAPQQQSQDDLKMLKEAVAKDPKNVNAWIRIGNISMDTGVYAEAVEAYQKALELDPKNVDVRVDMGTCYRNLGKPDVAIKEYRKALEIKPDHLFAQKNMGIVYAYDLKDSGQAIAFFSKYLQLAPNAPDAAQVRQELERLKSAKK